MTRREKQISKLELSMIDFRRELQDSMTKKRFVFWIKRISIQSKAAGVSPDLFVFTVVTIIGVNEKGKYEFKTAKAETLYRDFQKSLIKKLYETI